MRETSELYLLITSGGRRGHRLDVRDAVEFGRDAPGDGRVDDDSVSRRHAVVSRAPDGGLVLSDLGSRNGTVLNGERIAAPSRLEAGDVIDLGGMTLEVHIDAPVPSDQVGAPATDSAGPVEATLLFEGRRIAVTQSGVSIGRLPENDVIVQSADASRTHAQNKIVGDRPCVVDLHSANGTYLNGERLEGEARWLRTGDTIAVADASIRFLTGAETRVGKELPAVTDAPHRIRFAGDSLTIGRDLGNDVVLDSPVISRFHAEVIRIDDRVELHDLGSRNGTRLDGRLVSRAPLVPGSEIGVGPFRLIFDGLGFHQRDERGALRLDAYDVSVRVKGRTILERATVSVQPGELVVVIGESGSGKTTLLRVLVGLTRPSEGSALINGEPLEARLPDIGYLPQDEIVHPRLTVLESLRHSARLRLPPDSSPAEIDAAVARVLSETSLHEHATTKIGLLSGGQRKRVGLATELLSRPGLLFLDEPTTGLDPGLETRMMEVFRGLASVGSHALLVVTHATRNLELADRVCVLGRGGHLCFSGPPREALRFFGVESYDDIYLALDDRRPEEWRRDFERDLRAHPTPEALPAQPSGRSTRRARSDWLQTKVLASRYATVFFRDRRTVLILTLQTPLIALAMALLFKPRVFASAGEGIASSAAQLLFLLVVTTIWLGTIASAREIIKERPVFERERAVGVGIGPYLASKLSVLFPLVLGQATVLLAVVTGIRPLHEPGASVAAVLGVLMLTGFAAVSMGLLISALVRTEEQAMALIPIAMIAQLLFGGALVTVHEMGSVLAALSTVVFSRWAFAGVGSIADMNERIAADESFSRVSTYGEAFFGVPAATVYVILGLIVLALLGLTALTLRRRVS